jgi:hypothetical protein
MPEYWKSAVHGFSQPGNSFNDRLRLIEKVSCGDLHANVDRMDSV